MSQWEKPQVFTMMDIGFGPKEGIGNYIPTWEEIPQEFKDERVEVKKWIQLVNDIFFSGIKNEVLTPKEGIEKSTALGHMKMLLHSYDLSHEHKTVGVTYLMSLWFCDDFGYQVKKKVIDENDI